MCREAETNSDNQLKMTNHILICGKCGIGESECRYYPDVHLPTGVSAAPPDVTAVVLMQRCAELPEPRRISPAESESRFNMFTVT